MVFRASITALFSLVVKATAGSGSKGAKCVQEAISTPTESKFVQHDRYAILTVPYLWCTRHCPDWSGFPISNIIFVLFQFLLPTVVFALLIPRRWHLKLPASAFAVPSDPLSLAVKVPIKMIAVATIATIDMIVWITIILTMAGPIILSGLLEIYLDFVSIRALDTSHKRRMTKTLTTGERLSMVIAILCGNFVSTSDQASFSVLQANLRNHTTTLPGSATLSARKAQLAALMNGQASFGPAIGILILFYLGGFLYNALGISDETAFGVEWTPYAVWLMVIINVAVVSGTVLAGNNPSAASMVTNSPFRLRDQSPCVILADYYEGDLQPVTNYDRGVSKWIRLRQTLAVRNQIWCRETISISKVTWALLCLVACFLTLYPGIVAYAITHRLPWPRHGCRTVAYLLYLGCQTILILLALIANHGGRLLLSSTRKSPKGWRMAYFLVGGIAASVALIVVFCGSIFQIFGVYNNCWCLTAVKDWAAPANQKWVQLIEGSRISDSHRAVNAEYGNAMTWAVSILTGAIAYLGFWYQNALGRALLIEIDRL